MLLAPFQQFTFEVHLLVGQLVDIYEAVYYLLADESLAVPVASVEIDSANEGFESVASKVAIVCLIMLGSANELVETYFRSKSPERFSLHYLASGVGEETFSFLGKVMEDYLAYYCIENGIAKELKAFVVKGCATLGMSEHRLVHQGFLIEAYLVGIEAQHITKSATKFPILAEG